MRLWTLGLAALLSTTGCVFVGGGGGSRGDVTFTWDFAGYGCAMVPDVAEVTIQIPGETLANGGRYSCQTNGVAGITLLNFAPRDYTFTIQGRSVTGAVLYQASGSFRVNGDVVVSVSMAANPNAPGSAYVSYTFPPGTTVTCANLTAANIVIDNGSPLTPAPTCLEGATSPGILITGLSAGNHTIDITLRDANGFYYYRNLNSQVLTVVAGTATSSQYQLDWIVGSLPLKWTFSNGASTLTCGQVGVSTINIILRDSNNQDVLGASGQNVPCIANGIQGVRYPFLYAGQYTLYVQGVGAGNVNYRTNFTVPPIRTVTAGAFPDIDVPTPTELLLLAP